MDNYRFYKEGNNWYVDLPNWEGAKSDLLMIGGADTMLDIMSNNGTEVFTIISEQNFEGADTLKFNKLADDVGEGAYYILEKFEGATHNLSVFLCDVTLFVFGKFPETIYIKKISRSWRTLIRIEEVNETEVKVVIPGWDHLKEITLPRSTVQLENIQPNMRVHARVNFGDELESDLKFSNWEDK